MPGCGDWASVGHCSGDPEHLVQGAEHLGSCRAWCHPGAPSRLVPPPCSRSMMTMGQALAAAHPEPVACEAPWVRCVAVPGDAIAHLRHFAWPYHLPQLSGRAAKMRKPQPGISSTCSRQRVRAPLCAGCPQRGMVCGCFPSASICWALLDWAGRMVCGQSRVFPGTGRVPDPLSFQAVCRRTLNAALHLPVSGTTWVPWVDAGCTQCASSLEGCDGPVLMVALPLQ